MAFSFITRALTIMLHCYVIFKCNVILLVIYDANTTQTHFNQIWHWWEKWLNIVDMKRIFSWAKTTSVVSQSFTKRPRKTKLGWWWAQPRSSYKSCGKSFRGSSPMNSMPISCHSYSSDLSKEVIYLYVFSNISASARHPTDIRILVRFTLSVTRRNRNLCNLLRF